MQDGPDQFAADGNAEEAEPAPEEESAYDVVGDAGREAPTGERRRHRRTRVLWGGVLLAQEFKGEIACTVADISAGGAKLLVPAWPEGSDADVIDNLEVGHRVLLSLRASGEVPGEVVWQKPGRLGVRFLLEPDEVRERFDAVVPED